MHRLLSALATVGFLTIAGSASAQDVPPIKQVVVFGDSLADAGTYWFRFTTNPGLTFAQHLTLHYSGQVPVPNEHIDSYDDVYKGKHGMPGPGGLDYAEGGAKANSPYSSSSEDPDGLPISATVQLRHFLAQHQAFSPDQLVILDIGTNDVAYHYDPDKAPDLAQQLRDDKSPSPEVMRQEVERVSKAADDTADIAKDVLAHGGKRLVVFTLADMGNLPWFHSPAARAFTSELSGAFNKRLLEKLPSDPKHLLVIDTKAFVDDLIKNAAVNGFKHGAHEDACLQDDQDYCFPGSLKEPDADQTYIFAAGEHMTTRANQLLADYVLRQVDASPLK